MEKTDENANQPIDGQTDRRKKQSFQIENSEKSPQFES